MKLIFILSLLLSTIGFSQTSKTINNIALDQDLKLCVNDNGVEKCPIHIDGATGLLTGTDGLATSTSLGLVSREGYQDIDHANMTFSSSSGTWTVDSGDVEFFRVSRVGRMVTVSWSFITTSNSLDTAWNRVTIPNTLLPPLSGVNRTDNVTFGLINGTSAANRQPIWSYVANAGGNTYLQLSVVASSSVLTSTNLNYFYGSLTYEAQ